MDPSIISFKEVDQSTEISPEPKYSYSIDTLLELSKSPLVVVPEGLFKFEISKQNNKTVNTYHTGNRNGGISSYKDDGLGPPRNAFASSSMPTGRMGGFSASNQLNNNNFRNRQNQREDSSWGPGLSNQNRRKNFNNNNNNNSNNNNDRNDNRTQNEPEWFAEESHDNKKQGSNDAGGHSVQEFELWKAKMKAQEMRKAGYDVPEPQLSDFVGKSARGGDEQPKLQESGVDRLFGMWDNPNLSTSIASSSIPKPTGHASRFSSFFKTETSPESTPATVSSNPEAKPTSATTDDADKLGFQRVMAMLGGSENNQSSQDSYSQSQQQQQQTQPQQPQQVPQSPLPSQEKAAASPKKDNDLFFMSLLNKGSTVPSETSEFSKTTQSPLVTDSLSVTSDESNRLPGSEDKMNSSATSPEITKEVNDDNVKPQLQRLQSQSDQQPQSQSQSEIQPQLPPHHQAIPHGLQPHIPPGFPHQYPPPPPPGWFIDQNGKPNFPPDFIPPPPPNFNPNQPGAPPPLGFPPFFGGMPPPGFDPHQQGFPMPPPPPLNADGTPRFPFPASRDNHPH